MYGIVTYIYHKNQPNVGNIPYMDPMGYTIYILTTRVFQLHDFFPGKSPNLRGIRELRCRRLGFWRGWDGT